MNIKTLLFDLDDTLFDCTGQLVAQARQRAAQVIAEAIGKPPQEVLTAMEQQGRSDVLEAVLDTFHVQVNRETLLEQARKVYNQDVVEAISLFPGTEDLLTSLQETYTLVLVTSGVKARQEKKIELLGLKRYFAHIFIHDTESGTDREQVMRQALETTGTAPHEGVVIGDRLFTEIKIGNRMGMNTVWMKHGRFKDLVPKSELEEPDAIITRLTDLPKALEKIQSGKKGPRIVAIGGGTGLPTVLQGLKKHTDNLTAIVTVTDSGRSSGKIRQELHVLPPGDIRNCLVALSESDELMKSLFQYRFENGQLEGTSLGNLFIASLAKITGSFEQALKESSKILNIKGTVIPSTYEDVHICAELEDGTIREQELSVRELNKPLIKKVFLKPRALLAPEAAQALQHADLVILGPGSLYTSIITNLLPEGMTEALKNTKAKKVYISNIMTQPGQTDHLTFSQHVNTLEHYMGCPLDVVVVNTSQAPAEVIESYEKEGAQLVVFDKDKLKNKQIRIIEADVLEQLGEKRVEWHKEDFLRHDPEKLARVLLELMK